MESFMLRNLEQEEKENLETESDSESLTMQEPEEVK